MLLESHSLFTLVFVLTFLGVGIGTWIQTLWGIVTGGPRDLSQFGQPFLYDRVFWLFKLVLVTGWSFGLLSFCDVSKNGDATGFLLGWALGAFSMGMIYLVKNEMITTAAIYQSEHGPWISRMFYQMQIKQFERSKLSRKLIGAIFSVVSLIVFAVNISHLPQAMLQAQMGATNLINYLSHIH